MEISLKSIIQYILEYIVICDETSELCNTRHSMLLGGAEGAMVLQRGARGLRSKANGSQLGTAFAAAVASGAAAGASDVSSASGSCAS